jgi:hypothetical protein
MPRGTLQVVGRKAIQDPAFFRALMKDPEKALQDAEIAVSPDTLQQIKTIVRENQAQIQVPIGEVLDAVHREKLGGWASWGVTWMPVQPPARALKTTKLTSKDRR